MSAQAAVGFGAQKMRVCDLASLPETVCKVRRLDREDRRRVVYLIEIEPRKIKVGVSGTPRKRIRSLLSASGNLADRIAITRGIANAHKVESAFKRHFASQNVNGEWFAVEFAKAKRFVEAQAWTGDEMNAEEQKAAEERRLQRLFTFFDGVCGRVRPDGAAA